jgi:hypothetical protein
MSGAFYDFEDSPLKKLNAPIESDHALTTHIIKMTEQYLEVTLNMK